MTVAEMIEELRKMPQDWPVTHSARPIGHVVRVVYRDPECVERWPDCEEGAYHPMCCRFPKSCSCDDLEHGEVMLR